MFMVKITGYDQLTFLSGNYSNKELLSVICTAKEKTNSNHDFDCLLEGVADGKLLSGNQLECLLRD